MLIFRIKAVALARTVMTCVAALGVITLNSAGADHLAGDSDQGAQANAGERLIAERCNACHTIDSVLVRRATPEEWQEIIDRMVTYGAQVTDVEVKAIVSYLAAQYGSKSES
jgi:mono/diheme cytochrome c family protein